MMESNIDVGDEIHLVTSPEKKEGNGPAKPNDVHPTTQAGPAKSSFSRLFALVVIVALLMILFLMTAIIVLLFRQHDAIASLKDHVQELSNRNHVIEGMLANLNSSESDGGADDIFRLGGNTQRHRSDSRVHKGKKSASEASGGDLDAQSLLQKLLQSFTTITSMANRAFGLISEVKTIRIDVREIHKILGRVLHIVNGTRHSASNNKRILHLISHFLHKSFYPNDFVDILSSVDLDLNEIKISLQGLSSNSTAHVDSLDDLMRYSNTTRMNVTAEGQSLCADSVLEKLNKISNSQLLLLMHSQTKLTNTIDGQLSSLRKEISDFFSSNISTNSDSAKSNTLSSFGPKYETFCVSTHCTRYIANIAHCYKISNKSESELDWKQARDKCKELGGYLAEIDSNAEMAALQTLVDPKGQYWLGGTDEAEEGKWIWQHSRQPLSLTAWGDKEPNNKGHGLKSEHCLHSWNGVSAWNDSLCSQKNRYICERNDGKCWT